MKHTLRKLLETADVIEVDMAPVRIDSPEGSIFGVETEDGLDSWYVDGDQMVELSPGGCVDAKDTDDEEIEFYFAMTRPMREEDLT